MAAVLSPYDDGFSTESECYDDPREGQEASEFAVAPPEADDELKVEATEVPAMKEVQMRLLSRKSRMPTLGVLGSSMLVEPTTILPLDAPPLVPYDDGFSTESESWDEPPEEKRAEAKAEPVVQPSTAEPVVHPPPTVAIASEEALDAEEGEVLEQQCACCKGVLLSLTERQRLTETAALAHMPKKPLRSRTCACCRITYPLTAFSNKNHKLNRAVARCMQCSQAGGSAVYEMLAVSDEFIEAFTRENPDLAGRLLSQKQLLTGRVRALQAQNNEQTRRTMAYELKQTAIRANSAVKKAAQRAGREEARPCSEREGEPKRHLTVEEWYENHDVALRSEREHRFSPKEPPMPQCHLLAREKQDWLVCEDVLELEPCNIQLQFAGTSER
ncbi:hypothetical protein BBJ28_00008118 [Nothophytophthora sp. Chile5]|nr:hypothetical protein BBJ28_00008118 [Nothophytophthora sp. Chile5]